MKNFASVMEHFWRLLFFGSRQALLVQMSGPYYPLPHRARAQEVKKPWSNAARQSSQLQQKHIGPIHALSSFQKKATFFASSDVSYPKFCKFFSKLDINAPEDVQKDRGAFYGIKRKLTTAAFRRYRSRGEKNHVPCSRWGRTQALRKILLFTRDEKTEQMWENQTVGQVLRES